jgi:uncharacterized circularly permuted ATP-grasp superfamily protein
MRSVVSKTFFVIAISLVMALSSTGRTANVLKAGTGETVPEKRYNEVFDDKGNIRPHYRVVMPSWANSIHREAEFARATFLENKRGKLDSNSINLLPRMVPEKEDALKTAGVEQRDRAIQAFLHDHYSGVKSYAKNGIISEETVNSIITRSGEDGYQGLINGSTPMNFLYGPDLIRGPDGSLRALEDNIGFVGGFGDIVLAQEIAERRYPEIAQKYTYKKAIEFYHSLKARYEEQAKPFGGKVVFYADPNATDDSEDARTLELFEKLGIETLHPKSKRRLDFSKSDGVYVEDADGGHREKVGFIVLNIEHSDADLTHPAAFEKGVLDNAAAFISDKEGLRSKVLRAKVIDALQKYDPKKNKSEQLAAIQDLLKNTGFRVNLREGSKRAVGIVDAILSGRVGCSYTPGAEFVGDKEMYTYIESFIRFYLHEEPIVRNVETYMFNKPGTNEVNPAVMDRVFGKDRKGASLPNWVVKPVDGRGGDGITFGKETKADQIPALIKRIEENPGRVQAQRNTPPSMMPGNRIIDERKLTYSTRDWSVVSPVSWSRSTVADKSLLINVSAGGAVNAYFAIGAPKTRNQVRCEGLFSVAK